MSTLEIVNIIYNYIAFLLFINFSCVKTYRQDFKDVVSIEWIGLVPVVFMLPVFGKALGWW